MNYSKLMHDLLGEAYTGKQYKKLPAPFNVFAFIGVLPFFLAAAILVILYQVSVFFFKVLSASVNYLEGWLKDNSKEVKHATQAVLYAVCVPAIFFMQLLLSFFAFAFFIQWFLIQCVIYIASLGGIRWQPYINEAIFDEQSMKVRATTNVTAGQIFSIISFALFCLYVILYIANLIEPNYDLMRVINIIDYIYTLYVVIAAPITFRKKPELEDDKEEAVEKAAKDESDGFDELPEI